LMFSSVTTSTSRPPRCSFWSSLSRGKTVQPGPLQWNMKEKPHHTCHPSVVWKQLAQTPLY
jgi:hypothetical protein